MTCPDCGERLHNEGAESQGDGDIYDVWACPQCETRKFEHDASYCACGCGGGELVRVHDDYP